MHVSTILEMIPITVSMDVASARIRGVGQDTWDCSARPGYWDGEDEIWGVGGDVSIVCYLEQISLVKQKRNSRYMN